MSRPSGVSWVVVNGPEEAPPLADHRRFRFVVRRGDQEREVFVEFSGTVARTDPDSLASPLGGHVRSRGRSVLDSCAQRTEPPARIIVNTGRAIIVPRDRAYEPGDRLYAREGDEWVEVTFIRPGDPDEAVPVKHVEPVGGEYQRDVAWVCRSGDDAVAAYRYQDLRARPPGN